LLNGKDSNEFKNRNALPQFTGLALLGYARSAKADAYSSFHSPNLTLIRRDRFFQYERMSGWSVIE
jgi:hypothetical protein